MKKSYADNKTQEKMIDKLNKLTDHSTFWDDVKKIAEKVRSDKGINALQRFAEVRYREIKPISYMTIYEIEMNAIEIHNKEFYLGTDVVSMQNLVEYIREVKKEIKSYNSENNLKFYDNSCAAIEDKIEDIREKFRSIDYVSKYCIDIVPF